VLVACPDGSTRASLSLDLAELLARAKAAGAAACVVRPDEVADEAVIDVIADDVRRVAPAGWLRARWRAASALAAARTRTDGAAGSFWREVYRELRRHIGDPRLPYPLRVTLRAAADRAFARSAHAFGRLDARPFPRRLLRQGVPVAMSDAARSSAEREAIALGIPSSQPVVAIETLSRASLFEPAIDELVREAFTVVRIGQPQSAAPQRPGLVDVTTMTKRSTGLELWLLLKASFLVCESDDLQALCYLTNTPCLRLNAVDPFAAYPIRTNGLYALATAVELSTGRALSLDELHGEAYLKHPDHYGHRSQPADQIAEAVREMVGGLRDGWSDSGAQAHYRARLVEAGESLHAQIASVRAFGPDGGFIGDGRIANVQAMSAQNDRVL